MTTYRPGSVPGSRRAGWLAWASLVALLAGCQTAGGTHRETRGWSVGAEPGLAGQDGGGSAQDGSAAGQEGVDPAVEDDFGEFDDEFADFDEFEDFEDLGEEESEPVYDPLEGVNRAIHGFNDGFYVHVWDPLASGYAWALPQGVHVAVNRFFRNLFTPVRAVNSLLQWKLDKADVEVRRFLVNTTLGIGGLFEPAEAWFDLKAPSPEDFGQTLGAWGIESFDAIVNPPQAAILSVGAAVQKPVVKDGQIVPGLRMNIGLSGDHRVVDGAVGAEFLAEVQKLIEQPALMLL